MFFFKCLTVSLLLATSVLGVPVNLETRQSCSALELVHAAGTTESGLGIVGAPLSRALASVVPGTTTFSVPYDTSAEFVRTVAEGATLVANRLTSQASRCPNQRFVLSGYSKGALVLHRTSLPSALQAKVLSILVFGDPARNANRAFPINSPSVDLSPRDGSASGQNVASFCNNGDVFCDGGLSLAAHLAYATDGSIGDAANFVKAKV